MNTLRLKGLQSAETEQEAVCQPPRLVYKCSGDRSAPQSRSRTGGLIICFYSSCSNTHGKMSDSMRAATEMVNVFEKAPESRKIEKEAPDRREGRESHRKV